MCAAPVTCPIGSNADAKHYIHSSHINANVQVLVMSSVARYLRDVGSTNKPIHRRNIGVPCSLLLLEGATYIYRGFKPIRVWNSPVCLVRHSSSPS